jgi:hypothetical protein
MGAARGAAPILCFRPLQADRSAGVSLTRRAPRPARPERLGGPAAAPPRRAPREEASNQLTILPAGGADDSQRPGEGVSVPGPPPGGNESGAPPSGETPVLWPF